MTAAGTGAPTAPILSGPWLDGWYASDCLAVMDATATESAVLAGICGDGVWPSVQIAAAHPERVLGLVALAPGVPHLVPGHPWRVAAQETFDEERDAPEGWEKENRHSIRADHRGFLEFFFGEMFPEPHSTKQIEDAVAYGLDGSVGAPGDGRRRTGRREPRGGRGDLRARALSRCSSSRATATTASRSSAASRSPS